MKKLLKNVGSPEQHKNKLGPPPAPGQAPIFSLSASKSRSSSVVSLDQIDKLRSNTSFDSVLGPSETLDSLALPPAATTGSFDDVTNKSSPSSRRRSYGSVSGPTSSIPRTKDGLPEGEAARSRANLPTEINDRSPLLECVTQPSAMHKRNTNLSNVSNVSKTNLTFKSLGGHLSPSVMTRKSSAPATAEHSKLLETDERADFVHWMDSEHSKIEEFFKAKEQEAVDRFLLLQDQLFNLREQKLVAKGPIKKARSFTSFSAIANHETATRIKQKITKKIDMPSLPNTINDVINKHKMRKMQSHEENGGSKDYVRRKEDDRISYAVARRQLKIAVSEFYRSMELLKSYRSLNQVAFRKMTKKFDKLTDSSIQTAYMERINNSYFCKSDIIENLIKKTEDMFAIYFEKGVHKLAVEKLRAKPIAEVHYWSMFITGFSYGLSIPLLAEAVFLGVRKVNNGDPDALYLFQIWGGFFLVLFMIGLLQINCLVWKQYKINYPFIFELNPLSHLDAHEIALIPSILTFLMSLFCWLCYSNFWPNHIRAIHYPPIFLGIAVIVFLIPLPIFQPMARKWLAAVCWRIVCSGLYPVEFRDFFLGDIFCSLTYSISNASFFFCLYATRWYGLMPGDSNGSSCGSSKSRILGFLNSLPAIWRFLQCGRRYLDSGDWFPHLANMAKYGFSVIYYALLSAYRINLESNAIRSIFIIFAVLNTILSSFWDLFMDWSLMQPSKNFLLRNELGFKKKWPYYIAMILDPLLRCNWIFYAIYANQVQQSAKVSFFVALTEVLRRFIWLFFRVENEHCANVTRFRASRDVTLPYAVIQRKRTIEDEENQLNSTELSNGTMASTVSVAPSQEMRSTFSSIATPVLQALSFAIKNAHTRDFQRRKPTEHSRNDRSVDSDDDDDDDEDDASVFSVENAAGPAVLRRRDNREGNFGFMSAQAVKWRDQFL